MIVVVGCGRVRGVVVGGGGVVVFAVGVGAVGSVGE